MICYSSNRKLVQILVLEVKCCCHKYIKTEVALEMGRSWRKFEVHGRLL